MDIELTKSKSQPNCLCAENEPQTSEVTNSGESLYIAVKKCRC